MAAHGIALIAAIVAVHGSSISAPKVPGIWSPPKSAPTTSPMVSARVSHAAEVGGLIVSIHHEIHAALRNGRLTPVQARAFRRDDAYVLSLEDGHFSEAGLIELRSNLEALDSLIYAASGAVTPK